MFWFENISDVLIYALALDQFCQPMINDNNFLGHFLLSYTFCDTIAIKIILERVKKKNVEVGCKIAWKQNNYTTTITTANDLIKTNKNNMEEGNIYVIAILVNTTNYLLLLQKLSFFNACWISFHTYHFVSKQCKILLIIIIFRKKYYLQLLILHLLCNIYWFKNPLFYIGMVLYQFKMHAQFSVTPYLLLFSLLSHTRLILKIWLTSE